MHVLGGLKLTIPKDHDYWATESEQQDAPSTGSGVGGSGPISSVPVAFEKSAPVESPASGAPAGDGADEGVKVGGFGLSRHRTPAGHDYWATPGDSESAASGGAHSAPEEAPAARHAEPDVDYAAPRPSLFEPPAPAYAEPEPLFADLDSRYDRSEMYAERGAGYREPEADDRFGDDGYHPLVSGDETAIVREAAYQDRADTELQVEFPSPRTRGTNERAPARRSELDRGRVPKPVILGTAAALALVLLGGLAWLVWPGDDPPPRKPPSAGAGLPAPDGGAAGNGASTSDDPTSAPSGPGTSAPAPGTTTTTARPPGTRPPATPTPTPTPTQTTPTQTQSPSNSPSASPSQTSSSSSSPPGLMP